LKFEGVVVRRHAAKMFRFLKALVETMALKKLTSSVILNVTGKFIALVRYNKTPTA
jgi:hypothetical protein